MGRITLVHTYFGKCDFALMLCDGDAYVFSLDGRKAMLLDAAFRSCSLEEFVPAFSVVVFQFVSLQTALCFLYNSDERYLLGSLQIHLPPRFLD